jgi:hypothetical protein
MNERASAWYPVPDINDGFGSISLSYEARVSNEPRSVLIVMNGGRTLSLRFTAVIALHFEDDCPGNFPLPPRRPRLNADFMFPLLKIENSRWAAQWPMWPNLTHYALLSLDDLVHLIAGPTVLAHWEGGHVA